MYQLSRAIYRELAPHICTGREGQTTCSPHARRRSSVSHPIWHYFSNPARTLFRDVRVNFPLQAQDRVWAIVREYVDVSERLLESLTTRGRDAFGTRSRVARRRAAARRASASRCTRTATAPRTSTSPRPKRSPTFTSWISRPEGPPAPPKGWHAVSKAAGPETGSIRPMWGRVA